jgi:acetyl esterase
VAGALDPQVAALLEGAERTPVGALTPEQARRDHVDRVPELCGPGPELASVEQLELAGAIPARLYRPSADAELPVVVWLHGGGWVIGSVETYDPVARALALASGAAVVSVDYRLAPEHPYPAAVDDAEAAVRALADRAGELGLDGARMAIAGDSAGGNLATVVARRLRDGGGPRLRLQVLIYPVTDAARDTPSYRDVAVAGALGGEEMDWYWDLYLAGADGLDPDASPLRADDLSGMPPAYLLIAAHDPLRDEAGRYAERLEAAGVPVTVRRFDGMVHGFVRWRAKLDAAHVAMDELGAALRSALA